MVSGELVPSWVPKPEALPHKTLELENFVRTFLPKKLATVTEIRRLEGEMQMAFASLQADIVDTDSSQIDYKIMMQRCLAETCELIEKIKIAHLRLREAASTEEKKYV